MRDDQSQERKRENKNKQQRNHCQFRYKVCTRFMHLKIEMLKQVL